MLGLDRLFKLLDPEPVRVNQQACLRVRHIRSGCRACTLSCPADAVQFSNRKLRIDPTKCTQCGLCLGACPTAALEVRRIDEHALEGATSIRCSRASGDGVELPCLGALAVDHLVDLGSRCPGIVLTSGECEACPWSQGGKTARDNLRAAAEILQALGVTAPPVMRTQAEQLSQVPALTRRELFSLWRHNTVQTGQSLLPDRSVNPIKLPSRVPARRLRWLKRFAAAEHGGRALTWPVRQVSGECTGCAICVAFCPTGALDGQEAGGLWQLTYQAASCVDCHTCVELCPRRVMKAEGTASIGEVLAGNRRDLASVENSQRPRT